MDEELDAPGGGDATPGASAADAAHDDPLAFLEELVRRLTPDAGLPPAPQPAPPPRALPSATAPPIAESERTIAEPESAITEATAAPDPPVLPRRKLRQIALAMAPVALLAVGGAWWSAAHSQGTPPPFVYEVSSASPKLASPNPDRAFRYTVAYARVPVVRVRDRPTGSVVHTLTNPTENGGPLVFLIRARRAGGWLHVYLPVRPNGATGWIRVTDVRLAGHNYSVVVRLSKFVLEVYDGDKRMMQVPVAIGRSDTPTPGGTFYIKELLRPPKPDFVYGTFAYGLSGFSNVLSTYLGAPAVIGIHGTGDPSVIPGFASSGCIRMTNANIEKLVRFLPLGTPVRVLA